MFQLGLPNDTAGQTNAREARSTKKQLQRPEPAAKYPKSIHHQLSMVDVLEKIGISQHLADEIKSILDATYLYMHYVYSILAVAKPRVK